MQPTRPGVDSSFQRAEQWAKGGPVGERADVASSWIAALRWDPDDPQDRSGFGTGTLTIFKKKGGSMIYSRVPEQIFDDLWAAPSKGTAFNEYIKDLFPYTPGA